MSTFFILKELRKMSQGLIDEERSILDDIHWVCLHSRGLEYTEIEATPVTKEKLARHHNGTEEISFRLIPAVPSFFEGNIARIPLQRFLNKRTEAGILEVLTEEHCVRRNTVVSASFEYKGKLYDMQTHAKGFLKKLTRVMRIEIYDETVLPSVAWKTPAPSVRINLVPKEMKEVEEEKKEEDMLGR